MKIYDAHIHAAATEPAPEQLLAQMEQAGVYGGCIFSNAPKENNPKTGTSFEERLAEVLSWTKGYEDRLFPVMWIHPHEENIIENIRRAVSAGVCAFKIICNDFYVYSDRCVAVLQEIADLGVPVFFHSEIQFHQYSNGILHQNRCHDIFCCKQLQMYQHVPLQYPCKTFLFVLDIFP